MASKKDSSVLEWVEPKPKKPLRWKAKLISSKEKDHHQVKLTKRLVDQTVTCIVSVKGGYKHKNYITVEDEENGDYNDSDYDLDEDGDPILGTGSDIWSTKGINIHLEAERPIQFSFKEFLELGKAIDEVKDYLALLSV